MPMSLPHPAGAGPARGSSFLFTGVAILVLGAVLAGCLVTMLFGIALPSFSARPPSLALSMSRIIDSDGVDAAVARYQSLKQQGFEGVLENENATNDLGYQLLGRGQAAAAVKIFRLNAETHATSANAFDSLGEAQIASGDAPGAIASYAAALRIDPRFRSSAIAYAKLTGIPRKPYLPVVLLHITAGLGSILFGFAALAVRKGSRLHRLTGTGFFVAMLSMAGVGGALALYRSEYANILGASFTLYLLLTAWLAARRREHKLDALNYAGLLVAWLIAVTAVAFTLQAASEQASLIPFIAFGATAMLAAVTDLRVILAGGISGSARIARHLWRMCAAMFIAVASFFLGQSELVPQPLRDLNLQVIPPLLVILALFYWLFRNYYLEFSRRRAISLGRSDGVGLI